MSAAYLRQFRQRSLRLGRDQLGKLVSTRLSHVAPCRKWSLPHIATSEFLSSLKQLYPPQSTYVKSPWYAVAAITFSASNCPEAVPLVLEYVLKDLDAIAASHEDRLAAARKIRDAVFKSGLICGFPKVVINSLILLHGATPPALQDKEMLRNQDPTIEELAQAGKEYFDRTYGETAKSTQTLLSAVYPDIGFFVTNFAYGYGYAFVGATSPMETSFAMISALIAIDTPRQIGWHLEGAIRNGATKEEVRAVRAISIQIAKAAGVVWKDDIPDLQ
ncbi:hypothetical protein HD554DRAFT_2270633 [Boletus coccyginus]|nr:hypothetical protein HD554DRAFT_2270633 [Boletus coccyginus]